MSRDELKEIIFSVLEKLHDKEREDREAPRPACMFGDSGPCDATTKYAVGEEG